ncbi:MAG: tRNA-dihydrouridine synthase, partial [Wenzhouxiangella sp.]
IAAIKADVSVPVWANGDVDSPEKAKFVLEHTGVDGLLIGRAAQGRPWIFEEIRHYLETGRLLPDKTPAEVGEILIGHLDALHAFYGPERGVRIARKHIGWYARQHPDAARFAAMINRIDCAAEQRRRTQAFFAADGSDGMSPDVSGPVRTLAAGRLDVTGLPPSCDFSGRPG